MKKLYSYNYLILILVFLLYSGCMGIKINATKSPKKLFETFYVGEEGSQYFIKPISFSNDSDKLLIDFTFRYKDKIKDSAIVNISFFTNEIIKECDSLKITINKHFIVVENPKYLFSERKKDKYTSRFSLKIPVIDLYNFFNENYWEIISYYNNASVTFFSTKKTSKKIEKLNYHIFSLF